MKIRNNRELQNYFRRCMRNLENDYLNDYIGVIIESAADEAIIKKELAALGDKEFSQDGQGPSLYLSSQAYQKTPYNRQISLRDCRQAGFEYRDFLMPANELLNVDVLQDDPKRELNDYLILRAFDEPYKCCALLQDGQFWMSDNPAEANTIDPFALKARGRVLTFGLGIGYFVYMALANPAVAEVWVVEYNPEVIRLFEQCLKSQFPRNDRIHIIQGDAFAFFNAEFMADFDYVFVDIWKDHQDGLECISRFLENYLPPFAKVDFWIERTCYEPLMARMLVYFAALAKGQFKLDDRYYRKIHAYFKKIKKTIEQSDDLKNYIYDPAVIRAILHEQV